MVDDVSNIAESDSWMLEGPARETKTAHSGSAVELARAYRPDVVLCDLGMPGMEGDETCRRLGQVPGLERVVNAAVGGYGGDEERRRSREAGFGRRLVKRSAGPRRRSRSKAPHERDFGRRGPASFTGKRLAWPPPLRAPVRPTDCDLARDAARSGHIDRAIGAALTRFEPGPSHLSGDCRRGAVGSTLGMNGVRHPLLGGDTMRTRATSAATDGNATVAVLCTY
jgi:CheY-like chemotaxis protein